MRRALLARMDLDRALRLTVLPKQGDGVEIRVEGVLDSAGLGPLAELLARLAQPRVSLDLSGLTSADSAGRDVLAGLRDGGFRLEGASLYLKTLLQERRT